jgi:hypothetical protein
MDCSPSGKQGCALLSHDLHGPTHLVAFHVFSPNQFRLAVRTGKIDFDLAITEHMHMGGLVIVGKNDDSQAVGTQDRYHDPH